MSKQTRIVEQEMKKEKLNVFRKRLKKLREKKCVKWSVLNGMKSAKKETLVMNCKESLLLKLPRLLDLRKSRTKRKKNLEKKLSVLLMRRKSEREKKRKS